jgi:hypothetical protein
MHNQAAHSFSQTGNQFPRDSYFYFSFYYFTAVRPGHGEAVC